MAKSSRKELVEDFITQGKRLGNLTLLMNHGVAQCVGLNNRDHECIDALDWTGPVTAGRLSELMGLTTGAITGVVDRLEQAGYVKRSSDPDDRRKVIVELQQDNLSAMGEIYEPLTRDLNRLMARYNDKELGALVAFLEEFNEILAKQIERLGKRA